MESIQCRETIVTEYELEPVEGWTRNDIVIALRQGQAKVSGNQIVRTKPPILVMTGESGSSLIATIVNSRPRYGIEWS